MNRATDDKIGLCLEEKEIAQKEFNRSMKQKAYHKLDMIIKLKAIRGKYYLIALLQKIALSKELFLIEVQEGKETFIPKELSQDFLPYSFRYYDPVLAIIQESIQSTTKQMALMKEKVAYELFRQNDLKVKVYQRFGIVDNEKENKLTFKPSSINKKLRFEAYHYDVEESMHMQRSRYLSIDTQIDKTSIVNKILNKKIAKN